MNFSVLRKSLGVLFVLCSEALYANTATVVSTVGKVEVSRNNVWVALTENEVVREGEVISTGFKSEAIIKYKGSVMKLGPLTRITLEKLATSDTKDDVSVFLNTGAVRSTVNHSENKRVSYTVRNPIAVASVRGTEFIFAGNEIRCFDGAVAVVPARLVNPVRDLGISKPVDREYESEGNVKDNLPAEGSSTPFTSSSDINPALPKGVLVSAGQSTNFTDSTSARPSKPKTAGSTARNDFSKGVASLADSEGVNISGLESSISSSSSGSASGTMPGNVIVNIEWEE